jgi:hypothetical protein
MGMLVRMCWSQFIVITNEFKTTCLKHVIVKNYERCFFHDIIAMNLLRVFNINIYEMINKFMNTRLIFKLTHFMYFIDTNDKVYTLMCTQKLKVVNDHHA